MLHSTKSSCCSQEHDADQLRLQPCHFVYLFTSEQMLCMFDMRMRCLVML